MSLERVHHSQRDGMLSSVELWMLQLHHTTRRERFWVILVILARNWLETDILFMRKKNVFIVVIETQLKWTTCDSRFEVKCNFKIVKILFNC